MPRPKDKRGFWESREEGLIGTFIGIAYPNAEKLVFPSTTIN
jgi:hypothetical protein